MNVYGEHTLTESSSVELMPWPKGSLLKQRRTKIVATLGPASIDAGVIARLIQAGVDVFRLNMSHGDHESHRTAHERVRAAASDLGRPIAILADLSGPKLRVGQFADGSIDLVDGG